MIVYHGSYTKIIEIDLSMTMPRKDFGKGFYVTKIREQAEKWAKRIGDDNNCEGVVTEFIFYENAFIDDVHKVLRFDDYTDEWLDFVVLNRRKDSPINAHDYDIVEGPVADDRISQNITKYVEGKISREKFFDMIRREEEPTHQICFCSADSLLMLELTDKSSNINFDVSEISELIIEQLMINLNIDEEKATDVFYTSKTFSTLSDKDTDLYTKPWTEIYEMLKQELFTELEGRHITSSLPKAGRKLV
jgi:hypothetical protein